MKSVSILTRMLLILILAAGSVPSIAFADASDGYTVDETQVSPVSDFEYETAEEGVTITCYTGSSANVVIPSSIDGKPVVAIGTSAFKGCTALSDAKIPSSVKTVGDFAFEGCTSLIEIDIQKYGAFIGDAAFKDCSSLSDVRIPWVKSIGTSAFKGCTSLMSISIPFASSIGASAFEGCTALMDVFVFSNVPTIGERSFSGLADGSVLYVSSSATQARLIPCVTPDLTSIVSIEEFKDDSYGYVWILDENGMLTIMDDRESNYDGEGFTKASEVPWYDNRLSVTKARFMPGTSANKYMAYMFSGCKNLKSVEGLSNLNVRSLKVTERMFSGCQSLESLDFSGWASSVSRITYARNMFDGCSSLKALDLSSFVIEESANTDYMFEDCDSLESITFGPSFVLGNSMYLKSQKKPWQWQAVGGGTVDSPCGSGFSTVGELVSQHNARKELETYVVSLVDDYENYADLIFTAGEGTKTLDAGLWTSYSADEYEFELSNESIGSFSNVRKVNGWLKVDFTPRKAGYSRVTRWHNGHEDTTWFFVVRPNPVIRIAGDYANQTSAKISEMAFDSSDWVVVARDDDFADAMSATGLAGALECPIVLTDRRGLSDAAVAEVERLGAKYAYIIGGTGAMPGDFEDELADIGVIVEKRIFGDCSWDTSVACAKEIEVIMGDEYTDDAIVAMSLNFQDALSISSFAYKYKVPIYLQTQSGDRPLPQSAVIRIANASGTIYVPGGFGAVRESTVEDVFGSARVVRMYGEDGYDTSNQIAHHMVDNRLLSTDVVTVACGAQAAKGTDALAGAALAGRSGGVILLSNSNTNMEAVHLETIDDSDYQGNSAFLASHAGETSQCYVLGGTYVMPESLFDKVRQLVLAG